MSKYLIIAILCFSVSMASKAENTTKSDHATAGVAENLILITIDGLRWQELFSGADENLLNNDKFVRQNRHTKAHFWDKNPEKNRALLMPFFGTQLLKKAFLLVIET
ncbi:hypothetical protein L3081_11600 [Colwellia sp. MSW7]|uniref:Phosphoglyceromutase n=1 Tax=Colwellia maritima TaxID=2912588 RepID=A0ABS9X114_9GAMM|nr:hypothetical protein [Colwellia maritima]MCI2283928.1 hypothetical protein [Colwellia maritima]